MLSEIITFIKIWVAVRVLSSPLTWILFLGLFTLLLFLSAIFIRFKNGWVSVLCFFVLEILGIYMIVSLSNKHLFTENLHLDKGKVASCVDVKPEGVVIRKILRTTTVPLLGLKLPESESVYFTSAKEYILQSRFSGNLHLYYSSVYSGVVLCDSSFNSLNEGLLKQGLGSVEIVAPKKYISLQKEAVKDKRGMWEISSLPKKMPSLLKYSVTWLIFISSVCMALVLTTCLKRIITKYEHQTNFLTDQNESCRTLRQQ